MNYFIHYTEFTIICAALMILAFRPAWREWVQPTDATPLPVDTNEYIDVDFFAEKFRLQANSFINNWLTRNHDEFVILPESFGTEDYLTLQRPAIATHSISSQTAIRCAVPIYVDGNIDLQGHNRLVALYAEGAVRLGAGSEISQWIYAQRGLFLGVASTALCRISSAMTVYLASDCKFQRIEAPTISFGQRLARKQEIKPGTVDNSAFANLPGAIRRTEYLTMFKGDLVLPPDKIFHHSIVVTGKLIVGKGTKILGDVKAHDGIELDADVMIIGSVICNGKITMRECAWIKGPLVSETSITMGSNSTVGSLEAPTSVCAEKITLACGVMAHGSVWATKIGTVWVS